jgi:hypothetical protein
MIGEYCRRLTAHSLKHDVHFFAEKNNNLQPKVRTFTRCVFGSIRKIITVRDPRDVLCSHMAYFSSEMERVFCT